MKKMGIGILAALLSTSVLAAGAWREGVYYAKGMRVQYQGQTYEALQGHEATKGANWNPEAAASLWRKLDAQDHAPSHGSWREGGDYSKGQLTSYRGRMYRCLQSHKAEKGAGWSPDRAPSLWEKLDDKPYPQPR